MRLYEITREYDALMRAADEGADVDAALAALEGALEHKAAGLVRVLANLEASAEAYATEEKRLAARKRTATNEVERLRAYLRDSMAAAGIHRIQCEHFVITLSPGQERVVVTDESKLPAEYLREKVTREPDKKAILAGYKADGVIPPGVEIHPSTVLRVR